MTVSVVVESFNADGDADLLARLLRTLAPQLAAADAELVVTHTGLAPAARAALDQGRPTRWVELPPSASYYEHKNAGFAASTGDIVAFTDADCDPAPRWLAAMLAPFVGGARVVAGATSYAGALAPLANELDFPYFDARKRPFGATTTTPPMPLADTSSAACAGLRPSSNP